MDVQEEHDAPGPRRVLVTQWQLREFTGSEMVTLELVEHLARRGAQVTVVTHQHGAPVADLACEAGDVEIWSTTDPGLDAHLRANPPDLAWLQHQIVPDTVLTGAIDVPVVFHHMSAVQPLELPLVPGVEAALATLSTFNSAETLERLRDDGFLGELDPARLRLFANPAPDAMDLVRRRGRGGGPLRLLVVSNHLPDELARALDLLPPGVEVVRVGAQARHGAAPVRVDPELLSEVDGIVTIGKTVQYALAACLPVYCYDRFGGPGWLDPDNLAVARHHNFSGRGFGSRSADVLARDLVDGYEAALGHVEALRAACDHGLLLGPAFDELWEACRARPRTRHVPDASAVAAQRAVAELGRRWGILMARSQRHAARAARHAADATEARARAARERRRQQDRVGDLETRLRDAERELRSLERSQQRRIMRAARAVERVVDTVGHRRRRRPGRTA